jgi:hypothetical protein
MECISSIDPCGDISERGRSTHHAAPNNGMHPTPHHEVSHVRCLWARVMPGVSLLLFNERIICVMKKLDDYSQRFADVLFQTFPEWREFLSVQSANDSDGEGYLLVKVLATVKSLIPSSLLPDYKDFLTVDSDGGITVAFDHYHAHFDMFSGTDEAQEFDQAVEFIQSITKEKICPVVVLNGNEWCGSSSVDAGEKPDLSNWQNLGSSCQDVYVRSWHGSCSDRA